MMTNNRCKLLFALGLCSLLAQWVNAGETWDVKLDLEGGYGDYVDSDLRDNALTGSVFVTAYYQDSVGFALGYNRLVIDHKSGVAGGDIHQNTFFGSVRKLLRWDRTPGLWTLRLDGYIIENDDNSNIVNTDEGRIAAPQVAYYDASRSFYVDLGYAYSDYKDDLHLHQWTPTIGMGFNNDLDWVYVRGFFIHSSNKARTQGEKHTEAVGVRWLHYFPAKTLLNIDYIQLRGLLGRRVFGVDPYAGMVYNLSDVQTGTLSLGLGWYLPQDWSFLLLGGVERYDNRNINNEYDNRFVYFNLAKRW